MVTGEAAEAVKDPHREYPVRLQVQEPASASRWLWLVKWLLAFPSAFLLAMIGLACFFTLLLAWVSAVVLGRCPRWLFDFNVGYLRWSTRINGYCAAFVTDRYPPFALRDIPEYPVRVTAEFPTKVNRVTALFRFPLALPHLVVVGLLNYALGALWLIAGVILLFRGSIHRELHRLIIGIMRWNVRATGYLILATDEYPPFSLD